MYYVRAKHTISGAEEISEAEMLHRYPLEIDVDEITGPYYIVDEEDTVRAEGVCCREHALEMAAGHDAIVACQLALRSLEAQGDGNTDMAILCRAAIKKSKGE